MPTAAKMLLGSPIHKPNPINFSFGRRIAKDYHNMESLKHLPVN
jgi:hypothetical protein